MSSYNKLIREATKPKPGAPKPKYIDPIIASSFSSDGSLQDMCRALAQRLSDSSSLVVFRSLIVVHTLIRNGNVDSVLSYISSNQGNLRLRSVVHGGNWQGYDAPKMLGVYAAYLEERVRAYRELHHDVIRSSEVARTRGGSRGGAERSEGAESGQRLRKLTVERGLLREVHVCQKVCSRLLDLFFSYFSDNPTDELASTAFRMTFKDLFALYSAINEGVINVLEHYFEMAKTDAQQALDIYKRFCAQTEKIVAYMQTARKVSTSLNLAVPNLRHAPVSLAGALKEYLDDPNFEKNRLEYKESKRVADTPGPKAPKQSAAPASANDKDKQSSTAGKSIKIQEPTAEEKEKHVKLPTSNQAIQDFFESIDTDQNQMSMFGPQQQMMGGNSGFMMPQMTGMPGLAPQMTGYNPFYMQQQPTGFMQPQQTSFIQQQPTGFGMPSHNQSFLQPQMTGFNPFRQSAMPSQMTGVGGFGQQQQGMSQSPHSQPLPPPQHGAQDLQSTGPPSALDSFNSAFGGYRSASGAQVPTGSQSTENGNGSASPLRSSSAPLSAQKTGSRNPFAPPPGSTPPPKPAQLEKKGPSLYELAFGSSSGMSGPTTGGGGSYGLGAGAWSGSQSGQQQQQQPSASSGLAPQKTGLLGNVASEFVGGHAAGNTPQSPAPVNSPPQAPGNGDNTLSAGFSSLTLNGPNSTGQPSFPQQQQQQQLQPQPTGFGGSEVQPFKPESSFGQTLAANGGTVPSPIPAHLTGNPFAKVGNNSSSAANAGDGQPGSTEVAEQQTAAPTNLNGSSGYSQPASQATGFGNSLFASNSNVGSTPTSQGFQAQPSNFGSSLFSSAGNQSSAPAPFGSPQQQQQQGFQNGGRAPQPTGLGGSTVRPFQPSSAFGTSTFGAPGDTQSSQPQLPQQTQAPFQTGVPTGALF